MIQGDTPENLEHVLKTNFWAYEKGPTFKGALGDLFGDGIFVADGHDWKFQRKLASHIFNVKAFREYTSDVFVIEGQRVVDYLTKAADEGTVVDLHELFLKFTLDSFGTISFGKSFGCLESMDEKVDFAVSFDDLTATCSDRLLDPLWKIRESLTGVHKKAMYDKDLIGKHALAIIEKRRREGYHAEKKDLLQLFMEVRDENGQPLTDDYIASIILNATIAGRDTTAQALSWMFYLLNRDGSNPEDKTQLFEEVDNVLQGGIPSYETYKQLKFAEAWSRALTNNLPSIPVQLGLRLYPSVPRNMKQCVQDDVLPDGTRIYKGEWFTWSSYVMGRSELIWGPDAKEYKPSRWINSEKPSQGKFSSFHAGPRVCIGQQFATIEAMTIIAMILSKLDITLVNPSKVPPYGVSLTMPMLEGLPVRIKRRQTSFSKEE
ncbi:cytochrome P450 [Gamsiella multidivaricata]|uniref:cytochrome P450 n=1 Tax=Gamsiella multidivaricata TaxID=101098 RepID=UPI00221FEBA4|nr:cytochrome P450 [Gamsiella multidivaricata]KAI7819906.1 cytochrome P450 [Gamsiella multidivaricata]